MASVKSSAFRRGGHHAQSGDNHRDRRLRMTEPVSTNPVVATDRPGPEGTATVDLSVSIVTYNSNRYISDLIDSIESSACGLRVETLISENASPDAEALAALLTDRYPRVIFTQYSQNRFFTYADNQNMRKSRGRYVLSINPDSKCIGDALARVVLFLDQNPDVGAITPRIVRSDGTLRPSFGRFPTPLWGLLQASCVNALWPENRTNRLIMPRQVNYDPNRLADVEGLYGACILVRREVLSTAGYKDERFVRGWDEYDWSRRIQCAGWRTCYFPDATVQHVENASRLTLSQAQARHLSQLEFTGLLHLYRKHFSPGVLLMMKALAYSVRPALRFMWILYRAMPVRALLYRFHS
jgi:O-antigen biosynthesis protein